MIIPVSQSTLNTTVHHGAKVGSHAPGLSFLQTGDNVTCGSGTDFPSFMKGESRASPRCQLLPLCLTFLLLAVEPEDP